MPRRMTKQQVLDDFRENILPYVIKEYGNDDSIAKAEAWNDYTDSLYTDGLITEEQYDKWANPF